MHPTTPENERAIGPNLKSGTDHLVFEAEASPSFKIGGHFRTFAVRDFACTEDAHTVCPIVFRDPDGYVVEYAMVPADLATKMKAEKLFNVVRISIGKLFEQKDRGEGNPDLLDDSETITREKTNFLDWPNIETAPDYVASISNGTIQQSLGASTMSCWWNGLTYCWIC